MKMTGTNKSEGKKQMPQNTSTLFKRTITGFIVTVITYAAIYFSHIGIVLPCFACIMGTLAVYEIFNITGMQDSRYPKAYLIAINIVFQFVPVPYYNEAIPIIMIVIVAVSVILLARFRKVQLSLPFAVIVSVCAILLIKTIPQLGMNDIGRSYLFLAVTAAFTSDTAAYIVGKSFGRTPFAPAVSPNKTVEGFVGGTVASAVILPLCGVFLNHYFEAQLEYPMLIIYGVIISSVGFFGDITMSAVKRVCRVKDFGTILPGHGGILDRYDSLLFISAFTLVLYTVSK